MNIEKIGVLNFRELGGYPSADGRRVRFGKFYRGSALHNVCETDRDSLRELGIKHVIDLRSAEEAERKPDDFIPQGADYIRISANRLSHERRSDNLDFTDGRQDEAIERWLMQAYRYFPFANDAYRKVFEYIRKSEVPLYFHCAAGKDRTGACAALILYMLDVSKEVIFEDYLKSYERMVAGILNPTRTALVFREWLEGTFEEIEAKYPDRDSYFLAEFGMDSRERQRLKDIYLEKGEEND